MRVWGATLKFAAMPTCFPTLRNTSRLGEQNTIGGLHIMLHEANPHTTVLIYAHNYNWKYLVDECRYRSPIPLLVPPARYKRVVPISTRYQQQNFAGRACRTAPAVREYSPRHSRGGWRSTFSLSPNSFRMNAVVDAMSRGVEGGTRAPCTRPTPRDPEGVPAPTGCPLPSQRWLSSAGPTQCTLKRSHCAICFQQSCA